MLLTTDRTCRSRGFGRIGRSVCPHAYKILTKSGFCCSRRLHAVRPAVEDGWGPRDLRGQAAFTARAGRRISSRRGCLPDRSPGQGLPVIVKFGTST